MAAAAAEAEAELELPPAVVAESSGVRNSNIIIIGGRGGEAPSLSDMFEGGWRALEEAETSDQPSNSNGFQYTVRRGVGLLEEATRLVSQLGLFSRNEELEEIATADVKYLLLPALLGALTMKLSNSAKRLEHVQKARIYFTDFLKRCKDYNVMVFELPKTEENSDDSSKALARPTAPAAISQPSLLSMAASRQSKIERYNQKKETEAKLKEINSLVSSGKADDELTRTFYGLNLKRWISISIEEIESIDQEIQILKRMIGVKRPQPPRPQRAPMPPFILTRNAAQAKVFGAGYPSLATMTVDDWYEEHKKHSMLPDQGIPRGRPGEQQDDNQETASSSEADADDEQALRNAREKDEWKDTHRRGYGNRHNMG
ncbi:immunoglobulin-binding protein 1 [Callorhinchus milii]|uniref:immunoglobulin-binding protein 1 n=1 Tax=Callorhinchus milii TaxID=7868 RepID=UPI0003D83027|nr:immunoglobulin-binding protein 1 [Callorhinchus milii]|eukprot:gi/632936069/ref/XP_007892289.1/ PREDICTED: immunoglobulin-binding protein 1 [Callorhinchus milii]